MNFRLYIENQELDVPGDLSAQFNFAIDDIRDFASRNTSWSKTIVLPGTARNKKAFGHIFELGSGNFHNAGAANVNYNFNAAKGAKALITQDGIPIFKGVLRLLEVIIDKGNIEFETAVFGELGGLVSAMGDKKLEQLDFSAYNHAYTPVNMQSSWTSAPGSGYYYPLLDHGYTTDGVHYGIENMRPAFYAKEYLDKIFASAGYTYESDFLNSDYFKKQIIPFNGLFPALEVETVQQMNRPAAATLNSGVESNPSPVPFFWSSATGTQYMKWGGIPGTGFWGQRLTWLRSEKVSVRLNISFTVSSAVGLNDLNFFVEKNGERLFWFSHSLIFQGDWGSSGPGFGGGFDKDIVVDLDTNDWIEIWVQPPPFVAVTLSNIVFKVTGQPTVKVPLFYNDNVLVNDLIPRGILQKDFLKWIVQMFNLYLDEDKDREKHLKIEPYINYYDSNTANAEDWDSKIDHSAVIRIKPMGELNSRVYEYRYKDDSDYYNERYKKKFGESYGSFSHDSGFEFVKDKQTVEVGFSPSPLIQYTGTDRIITSIIKKTETSQERTAFNIRILFRAAEPIPCRDWQITYRDGADDNNLHAAGFSEYPYAGHLDDPDAPAHDLNWGAPKEFYFSIVTGYLSANLFNVFWSFYISEITDKDSKLLTAQFKLNPVDIYRLDFSKLRYVMGQYWRLNSISDYSTDQPALTKCELIKVIDLV